MRLIPCFLVFFILTAAGKSEHVQEKRSILSDSDTLSELQQEAHQEKGILKALIGRYKRYTKQAWCYSDTISKLPMRRWWDIRPWWDGPNVCVRHWQYTHPEYIMNGDTYVHCGTFNFEYDDHFRETVNYLTDLVPPPKDPSGKGFLRCKFIFYAAERNCCPGYVRRKDGGTGCVLKV